MKKTNNFLLKIMIVDDDFESVMYLKTLMDYESIGFEISCVAQDVNTAIGLINENQPDLIITDMKMPKKSGLELVSYVRKNHPNIGIIVVSGYEDFEFVYTSLKHNVMDYMLKHNLTKTNLSDNLLAYKKSYKESSTAKIGNEFNKHVISNSKILRMLLFDKGKSNDLLNSYDYNKFLTDFDACYLLVFFIDEYYKYIIPKTSYNIDKARTILINIVEEIFTSIGQTTVTLKDNEVITIVDTNSYVSLSKLQNDINISIDRVKNSSYRMLNFNISCSHITSTIKLLHVKKEYKNIKQISKAAFYNVSGKTYTEKTCFLSISNYSDFQKYTLYNLVNIMRSSIADDVQTLFNEFFIAAKKMQFEPIEVIAISETILKAIEQICKLWGIGEQEVFENVNLLQFCFTPYHSNAEIQQCISLITKNVYNRFYHFGFNIKANSQRIKNVIYYIHSNYQNQISLEDVADACKMNKSYLSRKFKDLYGKGVVDYIQELRIEKAKILLENPLLKLKEISLLCGFNSYSHFNSVFKKITNISPQDFRDNVI